MGSSDAVAVNCRSVMSACGVGGPFVYMCDNQGMIRTCYKNVVNVITCMQE